MNNKMIPIKEIGDHVSLESNSWKKKVKIGTKHKLIITIKGEQFRIPICNKYIGSMTPVAVTASIQPIFPEKYFKNSSYVAKKDNKIMP